MKLEMTESCRQVNDVSTIIETMMELIDLRHRQAQPGAMT
jgi:hypothetical protein